MRYKLINFLKYCHLDEFAFNVFTIWYKFLFALYPKKFNPIQLNKGDLVFDVGAHIGVKTKYFLNKGCKVVAFEPQSSLIEILYNKFQNNSNVIIEHCGISNQNANIKISICSKFPDQSSFVLDRRHKVDLQRGNKFVFDKFEIVPVFTLDSMIKKHGIPVYIKIDVETYETEVIQGLSEGVKYISFEYTNTYPDITINILEMLTNLGFKEYTFGVSEWMPWPWQKWYRINDFLQLIQKKAVETLVGGGDIYCKF